MHPMGYKFLYKHKNAYSIYKYQKKLNNQKQMMAEQLKPKWNDID